MLTEPISSVPHYTFLCVSPCTVAQEKYTGQNNTKREHRKEHTANCVWLYILLSHSVSRLALKVGSGVIDSDAGQDAGSGSSLMGGTAETSEWTQSGLGRFWQLAGKGLFQWENPMATWPPRSNPAKAQIHLNLYTLSQLPPFSFYEKLRWNTTPTIQGQFHLQSTPSDLITCPPADPGLKHMRSPKRRCPLVAAAFNTVKTNCFCCQRTFS